jgi:hypothetical protein
MVEGVLRSFWLMKMLNKIVIDGAVGTLLDRSFGRF